MVEVVQPQMDLSLLDLVIVNIPLHLMALDAPPR